jgi:lipopolysaccharide transport system ATP-binding protein
MSIRPEQAPAICVENLSKRYVLGQRREPKDGLRHLAEQALRAPLRWLKANRKTGAPALGEFWALRDVSFKVEEGDVLGVVGRNGAGKSTLLKVLSRITEPTAGRIQLRGRVASLLEVGTGFHQELTGRENIFLNGAILGMTSAEIRRKFDEIVAFSEVEKFLDTPVKRYSSGMYVRLAFAVAAHLEPEILVIDEVLAVGDAAFQQKCLGKMGEVARGGRTVIFVSHNMQALASLCQTAVWLEKGELVAEGSAREVVGKYLALHSGGVATECVPFAEKPRSGSGAARFIAVCISGPGGGNSKICPGDDVIVAAEVECYGAVNEANVAATVYDSYGYRVVDMTIATNGEVISLQKGERASVTFTLKNLLLKPGSYSIELWIGRGGIENIDLVSDAATLHVSEDVSQAKHSETFPGVYQCRFAHSIQKYVAS